MEDIVIKTILKFLKKKNSIMRPITGEKRQSVGKIAFSHLGVRKAKRLKSTLYFMLYFMKIIRNPTKLI